MSEMTIWSHNPKYLKFPNNNLSLEEAEKQPENGWEVWDGTTNDEGRAAFDGEKAFIKFVNFMDEHGDKLPQILVNVQVKNRRNFKM